MPSSSSFLQAGSQQGQIDNLLPIDVAPNEGFDGEESTKDVIQEVEVQECLNVPN